MVADPAGDGAWSGATSTPTTPRRRSDDGLRVARGCAAPARPPDAGRPPVVQARRVLRDARAGRAGRQRGRVRGPAGPDLEAGLPAVAGHRLPLAAAVLRLTAPRRRVLHPRLLRPPPPVRHPPPPRHAAGRGARPGPPGPPRPRALPHPRHPPVG